MESLSPWKKELLGMNTMKSSSIFKLSSYSYSNAYELEFSCLHVIIMIYELAYSLNVMIITCSTLCFNIHMTCTSRSRTRVEVAVHRSFGFAHILACQSIGLESQGDMGSFLVHGHGARVHAREPLNMMVLHG
jgi:hypothetical protein